MSEVRVTDPETGGEKGSKPARMDLIPPRAMFALAEQFGYGASKYADRNWERGYSWSLSYAALLRHLFAWWGGEDLDPESGRPHLAAVMFHVAALIEFASTHPEKDDRPCKTYESHNSSFGLPDLEIHLRDKRPWDLEWSNRSAAQSAENWGSYHSPTQWSEALGCWVTPTVTAPALGTPEPFDPESFAEGMSQIGVNLSTEEKVSLLKRRRHRSTRPAR